MRPLVLIASKQLNNPSTIITPTSRTAIAPNKNELTNWYASQRQVMVHTLGYVCR